mmetsp:Transcript_14891/g.37517  ORF Transcript_14891/g.37517 Transcript_14891/m.37517 type:complete len:278 (-) Transcript_14891:6-839(-)
MHIVSLSGARRIDNVTCLYFRVLVIVFHGNLVAVPGLPFDALRSRAFLFVILVLDFVPIRRQTRSTRRLKGFDHGTPGLLTSPSIYLLEELVHGFVPFDLFVLLVFNNVPFNLIPIAVACVRTRIFFRNLLGSRFRLLCWLFLWRNFLFWFWSIVVGLAHQFVPFVLFHLSKLDKDLFVLDDNLGLLHIDFRIQSSRNHRKFRAVLAKHDQQTLGFKLYRQVFLLDTNLENRNGHDLVRLVVLVFWDVAFLPCQSRRSFGFLWRIWFCDHGFLCLFR